MKSSNKYILCFLLNVLNIAAYSQQVIDERSNLDFGTVAIFQDSLELQKLDSVRSAIDSTLASLSEPGQIDSIDLAKLSHLLTALDSLKPRLPDESTVVGKYDSLRNGTFSKIQDKLRLKQQTSVQLNDTEKEFLRKHGIPLDKVDLAGKLDVTKITELPVLNVGNSPSQELNALTDTGGLQNGLPSIPTLQNVVPEEVKQVVDQAGALNEKLGTLKDEIKELKEDGLERTENLDELAEESFKNLKEVKAIESQLSAAEKLKQAQQLEFEKITNAQQLREQLASGKVAEKVMASEEQVKAHMEKMAKYKKKFDQLQDIRYAPKLKPNAMKGRPLKERIVPGMLFQIVKSDETVSWFLAPEVLYKFSGTFSGGFAGVYRFQYTLSPKVVWDNPLYGYKVIGQAKTWKSFYLRAEFERLNYFKPTGPTIDPKGRYWDTNWLVGVGRTQRISNRIHGHIWAFYNVNRDPSDIFNNRVILKSGIQFNLVNDYKKVVQYVEEKVKKKVD